MTVSAIDQHYCGYGRAGRCCNEPAVVQVRSSADHGWEFRCGSHLQAATNVSEVVWL